MRRLYQCPSCSAPVVYGEKFCGNCGKRLTLPVDDKLQTSPQYYCPRCSTPVVYCSQTCQNCGTKLDWSNQPQDQSGETGQLDRGSGSEKNNRSKFLKILAVSIIGIFLFVSLFVFGLAFSVNQTILNPGFVTSELNRIELAPLANFLLAQSQSSGFPTGVAENMTAIITRLEPLVKQQINASVYSIYDYLLDKRAKPDLSMVLRDSFISADLINAFIDDANVINLVKPVVYAKINNWIPGEVAFLTPYIHQSIDETLSNQELFIKAQLKATAAPIADYLSGRQNDFSFSIPAKPFIDDLKAALLKDIGELTIPEFAQLPPGMIEAGFNEVFNSLSLPASIEINQDLIGTDIPYGIRTSLNEAENILIPIRAHIGEFQFWYIILIVFLILLVAGIFLIYRELKGATRTLGIIFLAYAIVEFIFSLVIGNIAGAQLGKLMANTPVQLQQWAGQTINHLLSPLQILSFCFLIAGIVLIVVSVFYKRRHLARPS